VAGKTALAKECFDLLFVFDRRYGFVRALFGGFLFGGLRRGTERNRKKQAQPSYEPRAQDQGFGAVQWDWHFRSLGEGVRRRESGEGNRDL
jgi:hypothetical protein